MGTITLQTIANVTPDKVTDPVIKAKLPEINASIDTINSAISHALSLIRDLEQFSRLLNSPTVDKEWPALQADYLKLQGKVRDFTGKLKPKALDKLHKLPINIEGVVNGVNAQKVVSASITHLNKKNSEVLAKINSLVHEHKIQFPIPHTCPEGILSRSKKYAVKNSGWIVSGTLATTALATVTPLGKILAPYAANLPKHIGDLCAAVGNATTKILNSKEVQDILSSPNLRTIGMVAGGAALLYPAYSYAKEPVQRFAKGTLNVVDTTVTFFSKRPVITFLAGYGASYAAFRYTGYDAKIGNYIQPFWIQGAIGGGTVVVADSLKGAIAAYRKENPEPAPKPPQRVFPPPPVPVVQPTVPQNDDDEADDDADAGPANLPPPAANLNAGPLPPPVANLNAAPLQAPGDGNAVPADNPLA